MSIDDRCLFINDDTSNFAEVATFEKIYENCNDNYIGIEHNRRFFGYDQPLPEIVIKKNMMTGHKAIVCPFFGVYNNTELFRNSHNSTTLEIALNKTVDDHPEMQMTVNFLQYTNFMSLHNMMYTTKEIFGRYVDFLNDTLFKYNLTDPNDTKLNAHLAERYQTLFLLHNFKISDLCFANVTCISKDFTTIVNNMNGLDYT